MNLIETIYRKFKFIENVKVKKIKVKKTLPFRKNLVGIGWVSVRSAQNRDRIIAGESLFGAAIWCGSRDVVHCLIHALF